VAAFSFPVCVEGEFVDMGLREFRQEIAEYFNSKAQRDIIDALELGMEGDEFELEPDLPEETFYWDDGAYLVSIDMEELKGYRTLADAERVYNILRSVNEAHYRDRYIVQLMRKLDDEEVEEARRDEWLEEECYELSAGTWWCYEG